MEGDDDDRLSPSMVSPLRKDVSDFQSSDDCNPKLKSFPSATPSTSTAIVPIGNPRFVLPEGWKVLEVPRPSGNYIDKYYFEPGPSGKKFRSLKEVERYLNGQEHAASEKQFKPNKNISKSNQGKMDVSDGGMELKLDEKSGEEQLTVASPSSVSEPSNFALPPGWVVKEGPSKYHGQTNKNYYEPGTGKKFRSLGAVERYISEKDIENAPLSKMFKLNNGAKKSGPRKKTTSEHEIGSTSDFSRTHIKIKWVLNDSGNNKWDAFIAQSIIPESIRQLWEEKFKSSIGSNESQ